MLFRSLGGLASPTSGQILYQGEDIAKTVLADYRRSHVSFIFQSYHLIDYFNANGERSPDIKANVAPKTSSTEA